MKFGKTLWREDECTRHTEGHEGWRDAFKRLFNKDAPKELGKVAIGTIDLGDAHGFLLEDNIIIVFSFDGAAICENTPD